MALNVFWESRLLSRSIEISIVRLRPKISMAISRWPSRWQSQVFDLSKCQRRLARDLLHCLFEVCSSCWGEERHAHALYRHNGDRHKSNIARGWCHSRVTAPFAFCPFARNRQHCDSASVFMTRSGHRRCSVWEHWIEFVSARINVDHY